MKYGDVNAVVSGFLRGLAFVQSPPQLSYSDTALAHARLAAIPPERIVNCWPLDRLFGWLADRTSATEARPVAKLQR